MKRSHTISVVIISVLCVALLILVALAHYPATGFDWTIVGPGGYYIGIRAGAPVLSLWLPLAYYTEILLGPVSIRFECRAPFVPIWIATIIAFIVGIRRLYRLYIRPRLTTRSSEQAGR